MPVRARHLALAGMSVTWLAAVPLAQQPAPPAAAADPPVPHAAPVPSIGGSWKFDATDSKDDERNWRRPVRPEAEPGAARRGGMSSPMVVGDNPGPAGPVYVRRASVSSREENAMRRALRDLLELAETYRIDVGSDRVTMTDDLGRTISYATDGTKETHLVGGTEFEVESAWYHAQLTQTISAGALRLSQVFLPGDDGRTLFLEIRVVKPDLKPPVKTVSRVYRRVDRP
jgi:hypothetical protein